MNIIIAWEGRDKYDVVYATVFILPKILSKNPRTGLSRTQPKRIRIITSSALVLAEQKVE